MSIIGDRVKRRRIEKGLSVADLAQSIGVSKGYLHTIENGTTQSPSVEIVFKLAVELGTTVADLLGQQEHSSPYAEIPPSLDEFAKKEDLTEDEIQMLAHIQYRGQRPKDPGDWAFIYESIKRVLR